MKSTPSHSTVLWHTWQSVGNPAEKGVKETLDRLAGNGGSRSVDQFHKQLGKKAVFGGERYDAGLIDNSKAAALLPAARTSTFSQPLIIDRMPAPGVSPAAVVR